MKCVAGIAYKATSDSYIVVYSDGMVEEFDRCPQIEAIANVLVADSREVTHAIEALKREQPHLLLSPKVAA